MLEQLLLVTWALIVVIWFMCDFLKDVSTEDKQDLEKCTLSKTISFCKSSVGKLSCDEAADRLSPATSIREGSVVDCRVVLERLNILEREKIELAAENRNQRLRYEHCMNDVISHVVRVLLAQKAMRDDCLRLQQRVQQLQEQNRHLQLLIHQTFSTLTCSSLRVLNEAAVLCDVQNGSLDLLEQTATLFSSLKHACLSTLSNTPSVANGSLSCDCSVKNEEYFSVADSVAATALLQQQQQLASLSSRETCDEFMSNAAINSPFATPCESVEKLHEFVANLTKHLTESTEFPFDCERCSESVRDHSVLREEGRTNGKSEDSTPQKLRCKSPAAELLNMNDAFSHQFVISGGGDDIDEANNSGTLQLTYRRSLSPFSADVGEPPAARNVFVGLHSESDDGSPAVVSPNGSVHQRDVETVESDLMMLDMIAEDFETAHERSLDDSDYERLVVENSFGVSKFDTDDRLLTAVLPPHKTLCQEKLYVKVSGSAERSVASSLPSRNSHIGSVADQLYLDKPFEVRSADGEASDDVEQNKSLLETENEGAAANCSENPGGGQHVASSWSHQQRSLVGIVSPITHDDNAELGTEVSTHFSGDITRGNCAEMLASVENIDNKASLPYSCGKNDEWCGNGKRQYILGDKSSFGGHNGSVGGSTSSCDGSGSVDSRDWRCCQLSDGSLSAGGCGDQTFASVDDGYSTSPSGQMLEELGLKKLNFPPSRPSRLDWMRSFSEHVAGKDGIAIQSSPACLFTDEFTYRKNMRTAGLVNGWYRADSPLAGDERNTGGSNSTEVENSDVDSGSYWWQTPPCRRCWSESHLSDAVYSKSDWIDCQLPVSGEVIVDDDVDAKVTGDCAGLLRRSMSDSSIQQQSRNLLLLKRLSIPKSD